MLRVAVVSVLTYCLLVTSVVSVDVGVVPEKRHLGCPRGFTRVSSVNGCYKMVAQRLEWAMAGLRCRSLHPYAHLLVINSAEEQRAVAALLTAKSAQHGVCYHDRHWKHMYWTAGQRIDPARNSPFIWRTTSPLCGAQTELEMTYTNWKSHQPDYYQSRESCAHLTSGYGYGWNDGSCYAQWCSVCEIDM